MSNGLGTYAISIDNNFNLIEDIEILTDKKILCEDTNVTNIILIGNKFHWTINGKWKVKGKNKWYGSKGIKDFLIRFYNK